jgi:hypothetical protein
MTVLAKTDYAAENWGPLLLGEDRASARAFWACVLQFASADGATAVFFRRLGEKDCLGCEVDGAIFYLSPPPNEFRPRLLREARRLACPHLFRRVVCAVRGLLHRPGLLGTIWVETGIDTLSEWVVSDVPGGLRFRLAVHGRAFHRES